MNLSLMEIFSLITLVQLLFLGVVMLSYKKGKRVSNILLAGFLFANSVLPAHHFMIRFQIVPESWVSFTRIIGGGAYALLMPFLYLYILSLCNSSYKLKLQHLAHGTTYIIIIIISLILLSFNNGIDRETLLYQQAEQNRISVFYFMIHLQIAVYLIVIFKKLKNYRKGIEEYYSATEKINLSWLLILIIGFTTMWMINLFQWLASAVGINIAEYNPVLTLIAVVINMFFALTITYNSIVRSDYLSGISLPRRYASSNLTETDCQKIIEKLLDVMVNKKLYLKPTLTVEDLSREINIPERKISQSIHVCKKQNFYDFVNHYRVEEVKNRIRDIAFQHYSLLAIAYESGFSSKSVFNSVFKKCVGLTPSQFRKTHSE